MRRHWFAVPLLVLLLAGCSNESPSAASAVMAPPPASGPVGAGTVLSFTGAETGQVVTDATVVVAGRPYASDDAGHVIAPEERLRVAMARQ